MFFSWVARVATICITTFVLGYMSEASEAASYKSRWARRTEQDYPYTKTFADEQAARLEEPKFLHWVNNLRNLKKRAAGTVYGLGREQRAARPPAAG